MFAPRYYPPGYFAARYYGGTSGAAEPGVVDAALAGAASVSAAIRGRASAASDAVGLGAVAASAVGQGRVGATLAGVGAVTASGTADAPPSGLVSCLIAGAAMVTAAGVVSGGVPVPQLVGGGGGWRAVNRPSLVAPAILGRQVVDIAARISCAATLTAGAKADAEMAALSSGRSRISAGGIGTRSYARADNEFWLLAA